MLLLQIRPSLQCPVVIARCRHRPQDFTRLRLLSFGRLCLVVLRGHKLSFQKALNKVFQALGKVFGVPPPSAYSHARQKLNPAVFIHLQRRLSAGFYQLYEADDIYGLFFLMTLESILTKPAQEALAQQGRERATKFVPQVNRAESYVALLDRVVLLLLSPQSEDEVLAELHHLFGKNPTLQRPGRQYIRAPLNYSKTVRYLKYRKKVRA